MPVVTAMRSQFSRFLSLSSQRRWLLLEASLWLGLARAAVLTLPFRGIMAALGQHPTTVEMATPPTDLSRVQQDEIQQIALVTWAIRIVSRRTPWQSNCLAQALAGQIMLRRRRIVNTLYLGIMKEKDNVLTAHAWLRSHNFIVTGGGQLERYVVIARFCANP